jgi:hypothetical protein
MMRAGYAYSKRLHEGGQLQGLEVIGKHRSYRKASLVTSFGTPSSPPSPSPSPSCVPSLPTAVPGSAEGLREGGRR